MLAPSEAARGVGIAEPTATATLEVATSFVQWSAVIGGAFVATGPISCDWLRARRVLRQPTPNEG